MPSISTIEAYAIVLIPYFYSFFEFLNFIGIRIVSSSTRISIFTLPSLEV